MGKDYVPTLIQHPLSGKFIEVAPRSTVSGKASAKAKERGSGKSRSAAAVGRYDKLDKARALQTKIREEVDVQVFTRLHAKATGTGQDLVAIAEFFAGGDLNATTLRKVLAVKGSGYTALRNHVRKLKATALMKAIFVMCVSEEHNREYYSSDIDYGCVKAHLARYGIDPAAIEKEVRAKLAPAPVDKVNAAIDKRAAKKSAKKSKRK